MKRFAPFLFLLSLALLTPKITKAQEDAAKPADDARPQLQKRDDAKPEDVRTQVLKMVTNNRTWGPETSTPKMSLVLSESERLESNSLTASNVPAKQRFRTTIRFDLKTVGAPKDKTYTLVSWPVNAKIPLTVSRDIQLDIDGTPYRGVQREHPLDQTMRTAPGEPIRLGLISTDESVKLLARLVPIPLEGKDHGCFISATILTPNAEVVMFEGRGFRPNAEIEIQSASGKEVKSDKKQVDAKGNFMTVDLPVVKGMDKGNVKMTLKSPQCSPSVTVAWGNQ